jgi:hypothetical protein
MRKRLSQLLAIALPAASLGAAATELPPAASQSVSVNGQSRTVQGALSRTDQPVWRAGATRTEFGGYNFNITPGLRTGFTSRIREVTPLSGATYAIRLVYSGWQPGVSQAPAAGGSSGEQPGDNPVTCSASIETNTASVSYWATPNGGQIISPSITFAGAASWTLQPNMPVLRTDPLFVFMPPGTPFYIRSFCNEPIGGQIPIRGNAKGALYEGSNIGYSNYTFGTGNGAATAFSGTLPTTPIVPKSVVFAIPGFANSTDNGVGGCATGNGVASCTINYATGAYSILTAAAVANGAAISGWYIGGPASGDQTEATALSNFSTAFNNYDNPLVGPVSVEYLGPIKSIAVFGDSINEGVGNSAGYTDTSYFDYASNGYFGIVKMPINGLQLASDADIRGRIARISAVSNVADRVISDAGTNDFYDGKSLSQVINYFIPAAQALGASAPTPGLNLWWTTLLPRVASASNNTPVAPVSGPYTAGGAGFGSGAVVNPTPLGGGFRSGALGAGVLTCAIVGNGTVGPYACTFPSATMIGSLWSDGAYTTVIDLGSGGAGATTLSGSQVASGTHTPSNGAVSLAFISALPGGQRVNLYAFASGPSARNAWNYFLFNYAAPMGLIGGVMDTAACVESAPASALGAGSGAWVSLSDTADGTHPSPIAHQTIIPGCLGPSGTNPSAFWTLN